MSLDALLATQDEAALAAQASVGLVRRARRDLEAGKASITARDEASAHVLADGQTVTILSSGLGDAHCTCPATGICRHILLAALLLRHGQAAMVAGSTAKEDLVQLDEIDLRAFAGSDWDKAVAQALISDEATLTEDGVNLSVRLPDSDVPVVFLAGQGLKAAVWKGPKASRRRTVAAAAMIVRATSGGQTLDQVARDLPTDEGISVDTLRAVREAIEAVVAGVFAGSSAIAEERMFELSISVRADAAPRLTGLLRELVRQARSARDRHYLYSDERFLSDAANAMALTYALEANPQDPVLTGVLKRQYVSCEPMKLFVAGAVKWRSASGARGVRLNLFAPDTGCWFSAGQARAGGMDPGFSPDSVYRAPIWGVGPVNRLTGQSLILEDARVSFDHQIAWDGPVARIEDSSAAALAGIADAGALFDDWQDMRTDLARRAPEGLRRTDAAMPVVLAVSAISRAGFDDIAQTYRLSAIDRAGRTLDLTVQAEKGGTAEWLVKNGKHVAALLCEARLGVFGPQLEPVTAHLRPDRDGTTSVRNLTFDPPDELRAEGRKSFGERAATFLKGQKPSGVENFAPPDAVTLLAVRIADAVAETLRYRRPDTLPPLVDEADRLGLAILARSLRAFDDDPVVANALRVSYLISEVRANASLARRGAH